MKRIPSQLSAGGRCEQQCKANRRGTQPQRRRVSYVSARDAHSFIAVESSSASAAAPRPSEGPPNSTQGAGAKNTQSWRDGVGWRKLTERGRLVVIPNDGGCVAVEGCTAGFCVASYEGTKDEQQAMYHGKFRVEALFKALGLRGMHSMPSCYAPPQAGDVSGARDFCAVHLNTSSRAVRLESFTPGVAPRISLVAENVSHLIPNSWIHVVLHYASDAMSLWVGGDCLGQGVKLHRAQSSFSPWGDAYNNRIGVGVYGKTRMLVKSFRICPMSSHQVPGCNGEEVPGLTLAGVCPRSVLPPVMVNGEVGDTDTHETDLMRLVEREMLHPPTDTKFESIVALSSAKDVLREAILLPLQVPELFTGLLEPSTGVLLFGPPGNGKTMLASAVASMAGVSFYCCSAATLTSKWRGESEKLLRALFKAARARAPSVLFFDEADALCCQRGRPDEHEASRRFMAELLKQIDGLGTWKGALQQVMRSETPQIPGTPTPQAKPRVVVVAATNAPWDIDEALRRRLEKRVLIPLPDPAARSQLLHLLLESQPVDSSVDLDEVAQRTEGFSCADIRSLCREAAMQPLRRLLKTIPQEALKESLGRNDVRKRQPQKTYATHRHAARNQEGGTVELANARRSSLSQLKAGCALHLGRNSIAQVEAKYQRQLKLVVLCISATVSQVKQPLVSEDFEFALKNTRPSVSAETARRYVKWEAVFGSA